MTHINILSHLLEKIRCLQVTLGRDRLSLNDLRGRRLPLGVVRERLELRVVLLERVEVRQHRVYRCSVFGCTKFRLQVCFARYRICSREDVRLFGGHPRPYADDNEVEGYPRSLEALKR